MCGIAGVFHYAEPERSVDRPLLASMTGMLAHRGPDGEGMHIDGCLGFGHRRLSIVDITATGKQPMASPGGASCITYNGEFYNHQEFRAELRQKGYRFRGTSDTETLLYLLDERGPDCLKDVAGIFAFGYWDARRKELTLARDPLGVKQVYYHDNGRRIVFASEIKALLVWPDVPREIDPEGVNQYLHFHTALFERTFFRGIRQLRQGEYLQISRFGTRLRRYWTIDDFERDNRPPETQIEELRARLGRIVGEQLMSDVPVGVFFSGGIDSSTVAAYSSLAGRSLTCYGVHFSGQGVPDEEPYQTAAAKALGLRLELTTMDGSSMPYDLPRLMFQQDEPVIGTAMFPMYHVSRLAAREVKVCLGGQGADEIFGGYARYGLVHPLVVMSSWLSGRARRDAANGGGNRVGGSLRAQILDARTLGRLWRNARHLGEWETRFFENFAKVPESAWKSILDAPELCDREQCRQLFHETVDRSPAQDPGQKVMHWDVQTYLTGLFHQDDRMSMATSLESRVPLADPRMVRFAFTRGFDLKIRGGTTKWILRKAVSPALPEMVLNRRKVGFDTPVERWMKNSQSGYVHDVLLSTASRARGLWKHAALAELLDTQRGPHWLDVIWKVLAIETWASVFLDGNSGWLPPAQAARPYAYVLRSNPIGQFPRREPLLLAHPRHLARELSELGLMGSLARGAWEIQTRTGFARLSRNGKESIQSASCPPVRPAAAEIGDDAAAVAESMRGRVPGEALERLGLLSAEAAKGRILSFGRWTADYGNPIDWQRNPANGRRWPAKSDASRILGHETSVGDVKLSWEVARFPQAYLMARAAAFHPPMAGALSAALFDQIGGFIAANPRGYGIHWNSGQEVALRLFAWLFAMRVFARQASPAVEDLILRQARAAIEHIGNGIEHVRASIRNNHVLSESLGLYTLGLLLEGTDGASRWARLGKAILEEQAGRQFYRDGAYLQQSHNYHRTVMDHYLTAWSVAQAHGEAVPAAWLRAMTRSLDFLVAHQNPSDGRLPNYGANDGSQPSMLSCCDFSDFRPLLQALSVVCRGERLYEPGPWDEETAWRCGVRALEVPLRPATRKSFSFQDTGYHVLRGRHENNFGSFRCGTLRDRFSQMDMLHLDVWWRGENVLVDPGSYLYNGPPEWHSHFIATGSHNSVTVDGRDQMLPCRRFKCLYWTRAKLLDFQDHPDWALCDGEHYGYQRHAGGCVHRRSVLFVKDDLWIVADRISGHGPHCSRLHWLCGDFPWDFDAPACRVVLRTPAGPFSVTMMDDRGRPQNGDVAAGRDTPPRGWLSRYYGEKVPTPSFAAERREQAPITWISVLCAGSPSVQSDGAEWLVSAAGCSLRFGVQANSAGGAGALLSLTELKR